MLTRYANFFAQSRILALIQGQAKCSLVSKSKLRGTNTRVGEIVKRTKLTILCEESRISLAAGTDLRIGFTGGSRGNSSRTKGLDTITVNLFFDQP